MELISEENYLKLLASAGHVTEKYNIPKSMQPIYIDKARKIFRLIKNNDKVNQFLIGRFLEQYVENICANKKRIEEKLEPNDGGTIHQNSYYIKLSVEDFIKILSRITVDDVHLSEDEIKEMR